MPVFGKLLIYIFALAAGLALGRYALPSPDGSLADQEGRNRMKAEAQQRFWADKLAEKKDEPEAEKIEDFARLLSMAGTEDLAVLFPLVRDDHALAAFLAAHWTERNPREFYKFLTTLKLSGDDPGDLQIVSILLHDWAASDFESARSAALGLRSGEPGLDTLRPVLLAVASTDARKALEVLKEGDVSLSPDQLADLLQPDIEDAPKWGGLAVSARLKLVSRLPDSPHKSALAGKIVRALAKSDPKAAAAYLKSSELEVMEIVAEAWCEANVDEAMVAFDAEPDGTVKLMLGRGIATALAREDPNQAWEWATQDLSGRGKTEALAAIAAQEFLTSPEIALERVLDLPDAPWRRETMLRLAEQWFVKEEVKFNIWFQSLPDTPDRQRMLQSLTKPAKPEPN